jgi:hypothetical protein
LTGRSAFQGLLISLRHFPHPGTAWELNLTVNAAVHNFSCFSPG